MLGINERGYTGPALRGYGSADWYRMGDLREPHVALAMIKDAVLPLLRKVGLNPPAIPVGLVGTAATWQEMMAVHRDETVTTKLEPGVAGQTTYDNRFDKENPPVTFIRINDNQSVLNAASVLVHEYIHASLPYYVDRDGLDKGHGPVFGKYARALDLAGPLTETVAGEAFKRWFDSEVWPTVARRAA